MSSPKYFLKLKSYCKMNLNCATEPPWNVSIMYVPWLSPERFKYSLSNMLCIIKAPCKSKIRTASIFCEKFNCPEVGFGNIFSAEFESVFAKVVTVLALNLLTKKFH